MTNLALLIAVLLALGVICVSGITDAPNITAACVPTRSLDVSLAITMAAVCNCTGVVVTTMMNSTITMTTTNMVSFGEDTSVALVALCVALLSVMVWSSFTTSIGCPAGESHALIVGLTGAAAAICGRFSAINPAEWIGMVYGLIFSVVLGFLSGYLSRKLVTWTYRDMDRRRTTGFFWHAQIDGAVAMAFMHDAQGGQEFMGIILLDICMVSRSSNTRGIRSLPWVLLLGPAAMAPGTSIKGKKTIKPMGMDVVGLEKYRGFPVDMTGAACLLGSSTFGIPVSTTHTKTTAIAGVGVVKRLSTINFSVVKDTVMTQVMIFPGCGIIEFLMAKLFMMLSHR